MKGIKLELREELYKIESKIEDIESKVTNLHKLDYLLNYRNHKKRQDKISAFNTILLTLYKDREILNKKISECV